MALLDDVADELAKKATELIARTGDDLMERRIAEEIGASSTTLEEHFLTAMRIRRAEMRALKLMEKLGKGEDVPAAISAKPQDDGGH